MRGFGAPYESGEPLEWGFGDPTPDVWDGDGDRGFGSPWPASPGITSPVARVADDGGDLVFLEGDWPIQGPYRVRLVRDDVTYPDPAVQFGCYSALVTMRGGGRGYACETDTAQKRLRFSTPPLPPGAYDIVVAWGPTWSSTLTIPGGLEVVYRNRCMVEYEMRGTFPGAFRTGPRSERQEILIGEDNEEALRAEFPMGPMRVITRAIAQEIQQVHGRPMTLTVEDLDPDGEEVFVESLLAFPEEGAVFLGGRRYTYIGVASEPPTLQGLQPDRNDGTTIPAGSPVVLDVSTIPS